MKGRFLPTITTHELDRLARVASPRAVLPLAWLTSLALCRRRGAGRLALGTTLGVLAEEGLKRVVTEHRPKVFSGTPWRSFPSGHSAASSAFFLGAALMAPRRYRLASLSLAVVGGTAINWLRVRAGDHWTRDVLAGDMVGVMAIGVAHLALARIGGPRSTIAKSYSAHGNRLASGQRRP
jgi:membrane-associated phospholipid phosphatase